MPRTISGLHPNGAATSRLKPSISQRTADICVSRKLFIRIRRKQAEPSTTKEFLARSTVLIDDSGLQYTAQFTCRIFDPSDPAANVWTSTSLEDYSTEHDDHRTFSAKGVRVALSDDNKTYKLKITVNPETIVDFTVTRETPAFKIGKDGYTIFGTDPAKPWGTMRHLFWPRCTVNGVILIRGVPLDVKGRGQFVHALQGMKPHHAARRWNFANFQGKRISATMMEFTTPQSYGSTKVNVGGLAKDDSIISATIQNTAEHVETKVDPETEWHEPTKLKYEWNGMTIADKSVGNSRQVPVHAIIEQDISRRLERVDVLAEIPAWLKKIAHGVSGTKPFIYQYAETAKIKVTIGEEVIEDEGRLYCEATFIS